MGDFSWREEKKKRFFNLPKPLQWTKNLAQQALQPEPEEERINKTTTMMVEEEDEEEHFNLTQHPLNDDELSRIISLITGDADDGVWINSKSTTATKIQAEINQQNKVLPLEEQVPKEFHDFLDVFSEEKAARFPEP